MRVIGINIFFVLLMMMIACSNAKANKQEFSQLQEKTQVSNFEKIAINFNTIFLQSIAFLVDFQSRIMNKINTHSTDLVFVSDPFYATNFVGNSLTGYNGFYTLANKEGVSARIFVLVESTHLSDIIHDINFTTTFKSFSYLSKKDMFYIQHAKRVVFSPLLQQFAPQQYQSILDVRQSQKSDIQTVAYDRPILDSNFITIDYSKAMNQLGILATELATMRNIDNPKLYAILDVLDATSIYSRLQYFLNSLYQTIPNMEITFLWNERRQDNEAQTRVDLESVPDDAIIFLDAGLHTYSSLSTYFDKYVDRELKTKNRFLVVNYYSPEQLRYKIPVTGAVQVPQNLIFQNKYIVDVNFIRLME